MNSLSIIGAGFVGLVTGVCFANRNFLVHLHDKDMKKQKLIAEGKPPFYEPHLATLLKKNIKNRNLQCSPKLDDAVLNSEITFLTVGTPSRPDGSINLQYVEQAAQEIGQALSSKPHYHLVAVKSTVTPGTTEKTVKPLLEKNSKKKVGETLGLCVNPEFLSEGTAVRNMLKPDRVIIGENDPKSGTILENLYKKFHKNTPPPILRMSLTAAEMVKYASNAFLATKISFINEIANICEKLPSVDVAKIAQAIGLDKRIGPRFLNAGLGFGGSCFPKDLKALINFSEKLSYVPLLLKSTLKVNEKQPLRSVRNAEKLLGELKSKKIALLGLSFKPDTSDIREATSLKIINQLLKKGANITVYDPVAMPEVKKLLGNKIQYATSPLNCIRDADCCIIITEWNEFKKIKPAQFKSEMRNPIIIDGRKIYNPQEFTKQLTYRAIGLGPMEENK